ncbi:hypothetical protein [Acanthopleuribacter pedis]|uniref:Uncharacterized protein n=1 Tax=Acanthopleuribacter pedis TaxID=442870 RepID=A0A8J7U1F2_9BACT|nr:hypothetical protein [Acanthopleuribacter pedis]MBO1317447.1 hypothetical protein [Acanthopleuribacter pedis]
MFRSTIALLLFLAGGFTWANEHVTADLVEILNNNVKIKKVAVVYNPKNTQIQVPPQIAQAHLFLVQIDSPRQISQVVNRVILAQKDVDAIFLVDDQNKAVTSKASVKYLSKVAFRKQMMLHSDNDTIEGSFEELNAKISL